MYRFHGAPLWTAAAVATALGLNLQSATLVASVDSPQSTIFGLHELIEDPEDIYTKPQPTPFATHEDWKDWETWEASPDIVQSFPYCQTGYDLDGLAVFVIEFGKWDYRELAHHSEEKQAEFWKYFEQMVRRQQKGAEMNNGQGMVEIVDWEGFELNHHASPKAIKMAMRLFAGKQRVNEFLNYGYFVNVNFSAETFINTARPFLSNYLDKFEMYGGHVAKWKPRIMKKIAGDQLAPKYGGTGANCK